MRNKGTRQKGSSSHLLGGIGDGGSSGLALLPEEEGMDVGSDATSRDRRGDEELVQLLIVGEGELNMARGNRELVLLLSSTASQLTDLGRDVLYDGGHEHTSALAGSVGEAALLYQPVVAANREDQVELGVDGDRRLARLVSSGLVSFLEGRHVAGLAGGLAGGLLAWHFEGKV